MEHRLEESGFEMSPTATLGLHGRANEKAMSQGITSRIDVGYDVRNLVGPPA